MDSTTNLINPDARMGLTGAQPGAAGSIAAGTGGTGYAGGADFGGGGFGPRMPMLNQFRNNPRMPLIIAVAILAVVVAGLVMWSRQPDYRVLFSNLSARDGGAIVPFSQRVNVPVGLSRVHRDAPYVFDHDCARFGKRSVSTSSSIGT